MTQPSTPRHLLPLAVLFFFSGLASLVDQVVWLRFLSLTFGNTTFSAATLLAVFMAGLGFGALGFGRLADRMRRPLVVYAALEGVLALFAIFSPRLFGLIDLIYVYVYRSLGSEPLLFAAGRVVLAALFLLPPTLLMGATLPLMLRAVTRLPGEVGRLTGILYAANTLGATAGVALAGFVTIPLAGLYATLLLAAACNLLVALGCVLLSRPVELGGRADARPAPAGAPGRWLLALFFAMGATSLAYEVLWTRVLLFYLGSSVYAYSLMLFVFLLGLGGGSLAIARWADRLRQPLAALAVVELAIAALALVEVALFARLTPSLIALSEWIKPLSFHQGAMVQLLAVLPILLPPTFLMGVSFPLAVRAFSHRLDRLGTEVGAVYGANTVGSIAGSLAAGFLLIPLFGTQDSVLVVGAANAAIAAALWVSRPDGARSRRWAALAAPLACLLAIPLFPADRAILGAGMFAASEPEDLVYFHEDAASTVTILERDDATEPYLSLELNGVNVAGTSPDLFAVQKMQGHLPLLLASRARSVVHIGFGSGGTAHAVSLHPVEQILIVEISPQVLYASDRFFADINHGVLGDPRVEVEVNDGRNFVLASQRTFDAVLSDSIHPRYAGNGSLYSRDYFELLRRRMSPGGVASMWLPMYALTPRNYAMIVRAFHQVFPQTAVWYEPSQLNGFTIVTGKLADEPWDAATLDEVFRRPETRDSLARIGIHGPADVLACYLLGGEELDEWLAPVPPHVDDLPAVEYESGTLLDRNRPWLATFSELVARRPPDPPAAYLEVLDAAARERAVAVYRQRRELLEGHVRFLRESLRHDPRQRP